MYSSSIFDCTAYNEAHCDAGNGTSRWLLPTFSMRLQIFDLVSRISALRASKVGRGRRVAPHPAYEFKSAAFPIATERSGDTLHIFTGNRKSPSKKCKFFKKVFVCSSDLVPKEKISFVCWYQVRKITARKIYAAAKRNFSIC